MLMHPGIEYLKGISDIIGYLEAIIFLLPLCPPPYKALHGGSPSETDRLKQTATGEKEIVSSHLPQKIEEMQVRDI